MRRGDMPAIGPTIRQLLAEAFAKFADRPALLIKPGFRTRAWSYRDLAEQGPRVARVLADAGLQPGDRVMIWAVNRPEWGLAYLGALHAGLVLVPLDVRSQPDFAAKIARRTRAKAILVSDQTAGLAEGLRLPMLRIESLPDQARDAEPLPEAPLTADDLVEVVFTSGTTGEPKGAMITHGNLAANAMTVGSVFPFGDDERLLSILPLSHLFEQTCGFLAPLLFGCSIVYPVSRQPSVLMRTFRENRVTMLLVVPAGLKLLNNAIERKVDATGRRALFERLHRLARRAPRPIRRLLFRSVLTQFGGRFRTVAVGAAALEPEMATRWAEMGLDVLQGYGATELSPVVSFTRPHRNRMGTVGEAIPGVEIRIGRDGEVLARGPNVFAGYWEDPAASAAAIDADGFYHTGDIGELSPDGFLTLRGRKKDMLAMPDGTKVYPEDIEAVLSRDPRIRDATVVGLQPPDGELLVHAVLLLDGPTDVEAVIRSANNQLGGHQQIRSHSVWPDDDFPRTHTLKVKKRLIIDRLASAGAEPAPALPARTDAAAASEFDPVTGLVASLVGVPAAEVAPDACLSSDLNLDSISRVELLGVIEEELGVYIDDADLDPETTVAELSEMVDAARDERRASGIIGWPLNPVVRAIGLAIQAVLLRPTYWLLYRTEVSGAEHLGTLREPALLVANHHLHNDVGLILTHLPAATRWHLSAAAAADDIFGNPVRGFGAALIGNAFPLAREGAIRRSLELLGARLDRGYSILIFPEGKLTVGGPMQPFKTGTGLIAVEGATPVVPMRLRIVRMSRFDDGSRRDEDGRRLPWRGHVQLVIGAPIRFPAGTDHVAATEQLEAAVAAL
jgi:long-chain acyl-CoA synthetase